MLLSRTSGPFDQVDKSSYTSRTSRRRNFLLAFFSTLVLLCLFATNTTPLTLFTTLWNGVKSLSGCHSPVDKMSSTVDSAEGWRTRIQGSIPADDFKPKESDLLLTVLLNSRVEPNGFTMALFKPSTLVNASGQVVSLAPEDFVAFENAIEAVKQVPATGAFRGQWRVAHPRTDYPFDRILIPGDDAGERSVYGWSKSTTLLESETKGYTHLPDPLQRLLTWAREAREGYVRGQKDESVVGQVLALVET